MRIRNKTLILLNLIVAALFLMPLRFLDLFHENYSTLSLHTRGYLYLLFLGMIMGLLLAFETMRISTKKNALFMFLSLLISVAIPHHVPYNTQGNLHLLLAYCGSFMALAVTYIHIMFYDQADKKLQTLFVLSVLAAMLIYMKYMMINALAEVILTLLLLFCNLSICIKKLSKR